MRNIILIFTFIISFVFIQNAALSQDIYLVAYVNRLQNKIKSNWTMQYGQNNKTIIEFSINKDGKITSANIINKSGNDEFDQNALAAIYNSAPFESIPTNIQEDTLTIDFTFNQNELDSTLVFTTDKNDVNQEAYINTSPLTLSANITEPIIENKKYTEKISKKNYKSSKRHSTRGHTGEITAKTVGAGVLSLLIWPGLGQMVNDNSNEKVITHALLGFADIFCIFRIWSCYDALVDRHGGVWNNRI